jgi:hypothetical protein
MKDKLGNNIPRRINGKTNPEYTKLHNKKYYETHKKYFYEYLKHWQETHKEKTHKYNKKCRKKHKKQYNEYTKEYMKKDHIDNKEKHDIYDEEYKQRLKLMRVKILTLFGNKCSNPYNIDHSGFEKDIDYISCLQIDHKNGNGNKQRKEFNGANNFRWLNYILTHLLEFQLLCANCNWLKRKKNGEYIHK